MSNVLLNIHMCIIRLKTFHTSFKVSPGKKPLMTSTDSFSSTDVLKSLMICLLEPNP